MPKRNSSLRRCRNKGAIVTLDHRVKAIAGVVILSSLALAHWVDARWLWLTAFVGFNLLQSAFSHFCPMAIFLRNVGWAGPAAADSGTCCCK
jgi:hypothetical protein